MSTELKLRRGNSAQHGSFTGANGEVTFNTDTKELHAHDGITPGGFPLVRKDALAAPNSTVLVADVLAREFARKYGEFVTVTDFGADPSGQEDSAVAINRAVKYVANSGGGTVLFPVGTYKISRAIRLDNYDIETLQYGTGIRKGIKLIGASRDGVVIKPTTFWCSVFTTFPEPFQPETVLQEPPGVFSYLSEDVIISDMTIDMDYDNIPDGGAEYGTKYGGWGGAWPDGTIKESTWAADNYQYPIYFFRVKNAIVKNVIIKNSWFNGVEVYRSKNVHVDRNIILHCGDKPNYLGYYTAIQFDNGVQDCSATFNYIQYCGIGIQSNGDWRGYARSAVKNVTVANNVIQDCSQTAMYIYDWISDWIIKDNYISNIGRNGIEVLDAGGTDPTRKPRNVTIKGNKITNFNLVNQNGRLGIRAFGYGHKVNDNEIYQTRNELTAATIGVYVSSTGVTPEENSTIYNEVMRNTISGKFPSVGNESHISTTCPRTIIKDNTLISVGSFSMQAIRVDADDVSVINNTIVGTWAFNNGKRAVRYVSGARFEIQDTKYQPLLFVRTSSGKSGLSGTKLVDFGNHLGLLIDNRGNFNTGSNVFVADIPGIYKITALSRFGGLGTDVTTSLIIEKNGAIGLASMSNVLTTLGGYSCSVYVELNAGETIGLKVTVGSGNYTQEIGTSMEIELVKPLN